MMRILALGAVFLLALTLVFGCGKKAEEDSGHVSPEVKKAEAMDSTRFDSAVMDTAMVDSVMPDTGA